MIIDNELCSFQALKSLEFERVKVLSFSRAIYFMAKHSQYLGLLGPYFFKLLITTPALAGRGDGYIMVLIQPHGHLITL